MCIYIFPMGRISFLLPSLYFLFFLLPSSLSVSASVAGLEMQGIPHPDLDSTLILSTVTSDLSTPLVALKLEINPLNSDFDMDLTASLQPLQITYDAVSYLVCVCVCVCVYTI